MASSVFFDPTYKAPPGRVDARTFRCPCKLGLLFDITPNLVAALGVRHYECDHCHAKYAKRITKETRA